MPHKFEARPDHPAVAYLTRLHADLGGRIQQNKAEGVKLASDMIHVEAVLKMFNPDIIRWWNGQAEPEKLPDSLEENDRKFFEKLRPAVGAPPAAPSR